MRDSDLSPRKFELMRKLSDKGISELVQEICDLKSRIAVEANNNRRDWLETVKRLIDDTGDSDQNPRKLELNRKLGELLEEICELKSRLAMDAKHRRDFLDTIKRLTDENGELRAKVDQSGQQSLLETLPRGAESVANDHPPKISGSKLQSNPKSLKRPDDSKLTSLDPKSTAGKIPPVAVVRTGEEYTIKPAEAEGTGPTGKYPANGAKLPTRKRRRQTPEDDVSQQNKKDIHQTNPKFVPEHEIKNKAKKQRPRKVTVQIAKLKKTRGRPKGSYKNVKASFQSYVVSKTGKLFCTECEVSCESRTDMYSHVNRVHYRHKDTNTKVDRNGDPPETSPSSNGDKTDRHADEDEPQVPKIMNVFSLDMDNHHMDIDDTCKGRITKDPPKEATDGQGVTEEDVV